MPIESWSKLNLPESMRRKIKVNAAIEGLTMVQYIAGLVKKDERARGIGRQTSTPELSPVKEMNNT
jgi:hypothetical protein